MSKRRHIPQHEFKWESEDFRLVTETTEDGERVVRETAQRERDRAACEERQTLFAETKTQGTEQ